MRLRNIFEKVCNDIKKYGVCIAVVALCLLTINYVFGTVCPIALIFGVPCPGCGMTRAATALIHGQPEQAASFNAAVYVWIIYALYWLADRYIFENKRKNLSNIILAAVCIITVIYYIYRIYAGTVVEVEFKGFVNIIF